MPAAVKLSFGFLDMAWHTRTEPFGEDVISFEKEAWKQTVIVPEVPGTLMSSSFGHIFSGGYSAGYYGYKWAEVLDADAFSVFKETGIFNRETARSFRKNILSKGGTEDPDILYKRFRGKRCGNRCPVEKKRNRTRWTIRIRPEPDASLICFRGCLLWYFMIHA